MRPGPKRKKYLDQAKKMYESGMSVGDVGKYYGKSRQTVYQGLKSRGVRFRSQTRLKKENHFYRGGVKQNKLAGHLVERAIKKGALVRPKRCEKCERGGEFTDGRTAIQGHHDDYNKPLDVRWLCQACHHQWHKNNSAVLCDTSLVIAKEKKPNKPKICVFCGKSYTHPNKRKLCCSRSCATSHGWIKRKGDQQNDQLTKELLVLCGV